ncbi:MAG: tetratricopeptide repeat protein [bacterium]
MDEKGYPMEKVTINVNFAARAATAFALGVIVVLSATGSVGGAPVSDAALRAEIDGKWSEAVRLHSEQLASEPARADLWTRIADIEIKRGDTNAAIAALQSATRVTPSDPAVHARLSQAYSVAGHPLPSLQAMETALSLAPANMDYLKARAELGNWLGKPAIAADSYRRMLKVRPDDTPLKLLLARAWAWSGELDKSSGSYADYLKQQPNEAVPLLEYARVESWRGNFAHAIKLLDRYEQKFGDKKLVAKEKARLLASADRPRAAMQVNDPLLQNAPNDFELQFTRSLALHYGNLRREASKSVKSLEKERPDSAESENIRRLVETPLRPDVNGNFRYYEDNDKLSIARGVASINLPIRPETTIRAGIEYSELNADIGSGLENVRGTRSAKHQKEWLGLQHFFVPGVLGEASIGYAEVSDLSGIVVYGVQLGIRPIDSLRLNIAHDKDFLVVSPRSVSLGIERQTSQAEVQWQPDLVYTVVASGRYDDYSDGNERWGALFAPRRSVLRGEGLNIDLGVRGSWFGFSKSLDSGYYNPKSYQQYVATSFMYWKLTQESGVNVILAGGWFKDDAMSAFEFGWSADVEATFGAYSDWMLKVSGNLVDNFKQYASDKAFGAVAGGISLTRRF